MKTILQTIYITAIIIFLSACNKQNPDGNSGEPERPWSLSFILVDSSGNALLPSPLPPNPPYLPADFRAYNYKNESVGSWIERKVGGQMDSFQVVFDLFEMYDSYYKSPSYQKDSTIVWVVCFKNECDTVKIIKPTQDCTAQMAIWGKDTLKLVRCNLKKIYKNIN